MREPVAGRTRGGEGHQNPNPALLEWGSLDPLYTGPLGSAPARRCGHKAPFGYTFIEQHTIGLDTVEDEVKASQTECRCGQPASVQITN